ncbi:LysE/ArgO family amino acid transporter [Streptomyces sp. NBC_01320]|uniref:LysE/ArgO family amino acid transporter n=1 Tax=Streptomyces sp. NBC_01320 TaxID=2903824 RepID=UPI002E1390B0|nr:LysE family translocator [Streptomyces sp. NBC_01320]
MSAALVAGLLAGFGIAMPVGAVATYLVALTARTSLKTGVAAALGVATADGLYALIAVVGGSSLTGVIEPVALPLRWASALVLVVLALRSVTIAIGQYRKRHSVSGSDRTPLSPARAYLGLTGMTLLNPTTVVYFTALVLGSRATAAAPDRLEQSVFVLAAFAASAGWQLLLAGGGALLGRVLTGGRGRLVTALASSVLITALAVHLLVPAS